MIILFGAVIFDSVHKGHRIQDKVIVQVIFFVKVGCHNHLIAVAPQTSGELHPNFVCHFGCSLAGSKGLIPVVGNRPVFFAEPLFHGKHFITGGRGRAVDTRHKTVNHGAVLIIRFLRFSGIDRIMDHIGKFLSVLLGHIFNGIKFRVRCFIGILHIDNHLAEPAFHTPNRGSSHYFIGRGKMTASVIFLIAVSILRQASSYRCTSRTFKVCALTAI